MNSLNNDCRSCESLSQLLQLAPKEGIQLNRLVACLSNLVPNSTPNLQSLAITYRKMTPHIDKQQIDDVRDLIRNLIVHQFRNPPIDSIREAIANGRDAIIRNNNNAPIHLSLKGNKLEIQDQGDGMGCKSLVNFFVPGRSSNPEAIFSLDKGIPKVTGRFGQGGLGIFYYLLYSTLPQSLKVPDFEEINGKVILKVSYQIDGLAHEATFSHQEGDAEVQVEIQPIKLKPSKISIYTRRAEDKPLKMRFWTQDGEIYLNIGYIAKSIVQGTLVKIVSPLVKEAGIKVIDAMRETFRYAPETILLDGTPLSSLEGLKSIALEEGMLYYSAP